MTNGTERVATLGLAREGWNTTSAEGAWAWGRNCVAKGRFSVAFGTNVVVTEDRTTRIGTTEGVVTFPGVGSDDVTLDKHHSAVHVWTSEGVLTFATTDDGATWERV